MDSEQAKKQYYEKKIDKVRVLFVPLRPRFFFCSHETNLHTCAALRCPDVQLKPAHVKPIVLMTVVW